MRREAHRRGGEGVKPRAERAEPRAERAEQRASLEFGAAAAAAAVEMQP